MLRLTAAACREDWEHSEFPGRTSRCSRRGRHHGFPRHEVFAAGPAAELGRSAAWVFNLETVGQIATGIVITIACITAIAFLASYFQGKKPPKLAGTTIPQLTDGLDISKHYDLVYSGGDYGSQFVEHLKKVQIIGYVGQEDDEAVGKMYMRSRWLVVRFSDGQKTYLMPHSILSLQESAVDEDGSAVTRGNA